MSYDDLARLRGDQLDAILDPLRRAHAKLDRVVRGKVKGITEFGVYEATVKRQAINEEVKRVEAEIAQRMGRGVEAIAGGAVEATHARLGDDMQLRVDVGVVQRAQQNAAAMVKQVSTSIRAEINNAVVDALVGGTTREQFEQRMAKALGPDGFEARIERIARTELGEAYMQQQAANDEVLAATPGVDLIKRWVRSGKGPGRSRPEHDAIHGQERELEDLFDLGGGATASTPPGGGRFRCTGPLDPTLPPEQRIQCGCDVVRVPRGEAQQPYIASENPNPATSGPEEAA